MLIEYRVLRVEFRNPKLLSLFTGILTGLLGLQHLDTFPWGLERRGMKIVRECKLTAGRSCQANMQMFVSTWHGGGRWGWHVAVFGTAQASGVGGTGKTRIHTTPPPPSSLTTSPLYIWFISPPSIREDNKAVKNQECVSLFTAGALCLCYECAWLKVFS